MVKEYKGHSGPKVDPEYKLNKQWKAATKIWFV
jgi:hypothetical protein